MDKFRNIKIDPMKKEYLFGGIFGSIAGGAAKLFGADNNAINKIKGITTAIGGGIESIFSPATGLGDLGKGIGGTLNAFGDNGELLAQPQQAIVPEAAPVTHMELGGGLPTSDTNQIPMDNGTSIDGGNYHTEGGIDLTTDAQGVTHNVQKDEYMWDNKGTKYIFSNSFKLS